MIKKTLKEYLAGKKITVIEFARAAEIGETHLFKMLRNPNHNFERNTARKIAAATKKLFNEELDVIYN